MPKVRAKRSAIWLHFSEYNVDENNTTVKCNRCNVEVPYCKNTTNLWSHIRTHHTNILENASSSPKGLYQVGKHNNRISLFLFLETPLYK